MQKFTLNLVILIAISCLLIACGVNTEKTLSTKSDSLAFARAVMDQYKDDSRLAGRMVSDTTENNGERFSPISWDQVEDYSKRYDVNPCLRSADGVIYQGFSIDTAGYNRLLRTREIKGLYMRLGTKPNGDNTIMILGTDQNGKIINTGSYTAAAPKDSTNFDQVVPCPVECP
jgi:hypothetical protein